MFFEIRSSRVTAADGTVLQNAAAVSWEEYPEKRARLCRVSAACAGGLDRDRAVLLFPSRPFPAPMMAIENHSPFWCRPCFPSSGRDLPDLVQELFFADENGYTAVLPLCGDTFKTVLCGTEEGEAFRTYANCPVPACENQPAFLVMEGGDVVTLAKEIAALAGKLLGVKLRAERAYPPVLEKLGWCSWDAFQIRVSEDGLLQKAAEFRDAGVPVGYAIIDDMWADAPGLCAAQDEYDYDKMLSYMGKSALRRFEGAPQRFPGGMKRAVSRLKEAGIPDVGIWFPTTGYWAGLEVGGELWERERDRLVVTAKGLHIVAPEKEKAAAFFGDLCAEARAFGADFLKIDNQGIHERYRDIAPIAESARHLHAAIDAAAEKYFGGALINCMGMPSECMFHRPDTAVARCSDDFMPESREWFAKNVRQCAYNGLLQGQFYVNDWDMWWTDDEQAAKNSVCRAVSGGPVYVSDKLGRTRPEVLRPLSLRDGRLLRCDESATPTSDCVLQDPTVGGGVLKIRNRKGKNAVVAVFNVHADNAPGQGFVSPENAGLPAGEYGYYEYFSGDAGILAPGERLEISLRDNDDFRLYTFAPVEDGTALLGRLDLMIGVGAVERTAGGFRLAEEGKIGVVSRRPVAVRTMDGTPVESARQGLLTVAVFPEREGRIGRKDGAGN